MTEQDKAAQGGELGFDTGAEPQPSEQAQVPGQSPPEQIPSAPEGSHDQFNMPDRFQGKSAEDVAKSYVELEKMYGKANEKYDKLSREMNQIKSAILAAQQQGQMRSTGYDREPQYRQPATSTPEDKGSFLDNLLGDHGDSYLDQRIVNSFSRIMQGLQHQQVQQLDQVRQGVLQTGDSIIRNLTEESGMDYREADRMVQEELVKDQELYNRLIYQPQTFSYEEIDKTARDLFKRGQDSKAKAFEKSLKDYGGLDKETVKQLVESRKRAAQSGAPSGGATSHGKDIAAGSKADSPVDLWLQGKL